MVHRITKRSRAFTLIELLVVIAIISTLIGLLLPAVQKVREASNRTRCGNNLKQMSLGLHNYALGFDMFPPAYRNEPSNPYDYRPGWGWAMLTLPYVEQDSLYKQFNYPPALFGGGANPALATPLTQTPLKIYRCPTDNGPDRNSFRFDHAMANYRAVCGADAAGGIFRTNEDRGGVMFQNSKIRIADITDGTSNTIMLGECMFDEPTNKWAAIWPGMVGVTGNSVFISCVMWQVDDASAVINGPAPQAFSSRHYGGAYFAFADGSIRFFREGGNVQTLKWLAGRNDGKVVTPEF